MSKERDCIKMIRQIAGGQSYDTYLCNVTKVNGATCDVERVLDNKEIKGVRLNATIQVSNKSATKPGKDEPETQPENNVLVVEPEKDSYVLVTNIDGDKYFVSQFSAIKQITLNVADKLIINGGTNGGLTITPELQKQLEKMSARIDGIIKAIKNAVPGGQDGGIGLQETMTVLLNEIIEIEDFSNITDDKITH